MQISAFLIVPIILMMLTGCGQSSDNGTPDSIIIETQVETLDKAKNVEDVLMQSEQKQREAIDSYE